MKPLVFVLDYELVIFIHNMNKICSSVYHIIRKYKCTPQLLLQIVLW